MATTWPATRAAATPCRAVECAARARAILPTRTMRRMSDMAMLPTVACAMVKFVAMAIEERANRQTHKYTYTIYTHTNVILIPVICHSQILSVCAFFGQNSAMLPPRSVICILSRTLPALIAFKIPKTKQAKMYINPKIK